MIANESEYKWKTNKLIGVDISLSDTYEEIESLVLTEDVSGEAKDEKELKPECIY
jgi:hypothetical protein